MKSGRIGTIRLNREETECFVDSFFYPSKEQIAEHEIIRDIINEDVSIRRTDKGFEADVESLDFSFLDGSVSNESFHFSIMLSTRFFNILKTKYIRLSDCENDKNYLQAEGNVGNIEYTSCDTDDITQFAA